MHIYLIKNQNTTCMTERHHIGRSRFFALEIGRLLTHVSKKASKIFVSTGYFSIPEDVYPLLRLSISAPFSIWLSLLKKVCQNNLKINSFIRAYVNYT